MTTARARHILVHSQQECESIKERLEAGADFAATARLSSTCPSKERGGDLGEFSPGQMVREFDEVVFSAELGKIHGPIKTRFGYHLIRIEMRSES